MEIAEGRRGEVVVLSVHGRHHPGRMALHRHVIAGIEGGGSKFVVDLTGVPWLGSDGVRDLIAAFKEIETSGGRLGVVLSRVEMHRGSHGVFDVFDTLDDALEFLRD